MDAISGSAPVPVYKRYEHLLQGLEDGSVSFKDALMAHLDMEDMEPDMEDMEPDMEDMEPGRQDWLTMPVGVVVGFVSDVMNVSVVTVAEKEAVIDDIAIASSPTGANHFRGDFLPPGTDEYLALVETLGIAMHAAETLFSSFGNHNTMSAIYDGIHALYKKVESLGALDSREKVLALGSRIREEIDDFVKHYQLGDAMQALAQAYEQAYKDKQARKRLALDGPDFEKTIFDDRFMHRNVRLDYKQAGHLYLYNYASKHRDRWAAAAEELDIDILGHHYTTHFFETPDGTGIDVRAGVPQTEAERIFRHIASAKDIAAFDRQMEPHRTEMTEKMTSYVSGILEAAYEDLKKFEPRLEAMGEAMREVGITPDDMAQIIIVRHGDAYRVEEVWGTLAPGKAATIENFINSNPDVRALYHEGRTPSGVRTLQPVIFEDA